MNYKPRWVRSQVIAGAELAVFLTHALVVIPNASRKGIVPPRPDGFWWSVDASHEGECETLELAKAAAESKALDIALAGKEKPS